MRSISLLLTLATVLLLLPGCSVSKLLPPGEYLYRGASIEVEHPDTVNVAELKPALDAAISTTTTPRWKAWWYLKFKQENNRGLKNWLATTLGKEPIYYEEAVTQQSIRLLENRAFNLGFFRATAAATTDTAHTQRGISANYTINVGEPYLFDSLYHAIQDTSVAYLVDSVADETLIKLGDNYNLFTLRNERQRLQQVMRQRGYYYFSGNDLEYFADSISSNHRIPLLLKLKDQLASEKLTPQYIESVRVYADYRLGSSASAQQGDTTRYAELTIVCETCPLRSETLAEGITIRPGHRYSPREHQRTLERLSNFNTFKYINLSYDTVPGVDSLLYLDVFLTPRARRTVEGEAGLVFNSGSYVGPEALLTWYNRNLLRGAEFLRLDANFSYNFYLGSQDRSAFPSFGRYGLRAAVNVPRLWLPGREKVLPGIERGNTQIGVGFQTESLPFPLNNQRFLPLLTDDNLPQLSAAFIADSSYAPRASFTTWTATYGYNWQRVRHVRHETNPLSLRLQTVSTTDEELPLLLREAALQEAAGQSNLLRLDRMIIYSPDYTFLYDSRLKESKPSQIFYRQRLSMNVNRVTPTGLLAERGDQSEVSYYAQVETDVRHYWQFSSATQLASRLRAFVGYPLSRRAIIPYFDLYTVGGPNSMRAYLPRGIGPGVLAQDPNSFSPFLGYGNVLMEANVEIRQKINSIIEIALFSDIGNVWEYRTQNPALESDFRVRNFRQEVAVVGGLGTRLNFGFLLLRLDFALPLVQPFPETTQGFDLGNLNWVLAFGYPF